MDRACVVVLPELTDDDIVCLKRWAQTHFDEYAMNDDRLTLTGAKRRSLQWIQNYIQKQCAKHLGICMDNICFESLRCMQSRLYI